FLAAAFPRVADRGADEALRAYVSHKGLNPTSLQSTSRTSPSDNAAALDAVQQQLTARIGRELTLAQPGRASGTRALTPRAMDNPGYPKTPDRPPPILSLYYLQGLADRVTLPDGTWPAPAPADGPIPIVLSRAAADTIHVGLGDVIDNGTEGP